jgi:hypothetical protein
MVLYLPNDPFFFIDFKTSFHCVTHLVGPPPPISTWFVILQLYIIGIHFFHCTHGGERMVSHDVVWDAFASIARDLGFHVLHEQTHIFLLPIF